jgi:hypothetical protein
LEPFVAAAFFAQLEKSKKAKRHFISGENQRKKHQLKNVTT